MLDEEINRLYRLARDELQSSGAFLRTDRGECLFVSDAPRRGYAAFAPLEAEFECRVTNGLLYLAPRLTGVPQSLRAVYLSLLKTNGAAREAILRKTLAKSMRLHNTEEIEYLNKIWEDERLC